MAVAPRLVPDIVKKLGPLNICADTKCTRVVVEKPFGHDLKSAHELNDCLRACLMKNRFIASIITSEKKPFRISWHFVLPMRCLNPSGTGIILSMFRLPLPKQWVWKGVAVIMKPPGALSDMVQNHILQLMCMIAMEAPVSFDANEIRNKKVDVLHAIRKISNEEVPQYAVRGQYAKDG